MTVFVEETDSRVHRPRHLDDARGNALDVADAILVLRPLVILVEILAVGTDVHVEDRRFQAGRMVLGHHRLLRRSHATDRGAILVSALGIAGADALNPSDLPGFLLVGQPHDMSLEGTGRGQHPLEFNARQDVGVSAVPEFALAGGVEFLETGGQHNRSDLQFHRSLAHEVVDGILLAGRDTLAALGAQRTVEASLRFGQRLLLRQSHLHFFEVALPLGHWKLSAPAPSLLLHVLRVRQEFLWNGLERVFESVGTQVQAVEIAMNGLGGPFPGPHGLDDRSGTRDRVATGKDAGQRGLSRHSVGLDNPALGLNAEMR